MIGVGNPISEWTIKSLKDDARKELEGTSDEYRSSLAKLLLLTFEQWKEDHGDRNPPDGHGLLSTGIIPFDSAHPWQCAGFGVSNPIDLAFKLWLDKYPPFTRIINITPIERIFALLIVLANSQSDGDSVVRAQNLVHEFRIKRVLESYRYVLRWAEMGVNHSKTQSAKGRLSKNKPRGYLGEYTEDTMTSLVGSLANKKDALGDWIPAAELWPELFADLDSLDLNPEETSEGEKAKHFYTYDFRGKRKSYTYGTFKVAISKARNSCNNPDRYIKPGS